MAVKIPIDDNTTLLNAIKAKAQALPNGSSGGGVDLSGVTAGASDVLYGKVIVGANGIEIIGTMPNNGAISQTIDSNGTITIPAGYHNGSGTYTIAVPSSSSIPTDGTAAASDVRSGETFYSGGTKKTGTMASVTLGTPSISVSYSGLITAEVSHGKSGYVAASTKQGTKQMSTYGGGARTPSRDSQTVSLSGKYCIGDLMINGDNNFLPENIKSGITIWGVAGTYGGGSDSGTYITATGDATVLSPSYSFIVYNICSGISDATNILTISAFRFDTITPDYNNTVMYAHYNYKDSSGICIYGTKDSMSQADSSTAVEYQKTGSNLTVRSSSYRFEGSYIFAITYKN